MCMNKPCTSKTNDMWPSLIFNFRFSTNIIIKNTQVIKTEEKDKAIDYDVQSLQSRLRFSFSSLFILLEWYFAQLLNHDNTQFFFLLEIEIFYSSDEGECALGIFFHKVIAYWGLQCPDNDILHSADKFCHFNKD